jgi:hypothetical protein
MQFKKQSVFASLFLSLLLIGVPANPQDADAKGPGRMPIYSGKDGTIVGWAGELPEEPEASAEPKPLTPADQVEAAKKMLVLFAVDNRISQLAAEIKELQAQNAKNRKEFDDWQNAKRTEYGAKPEQSITLELQWSEPVGSK